jgi:hypothetical protein
MPSSLPQPWKRARRCRVCRRGGCLVAGPLDSPPAAICRRVESAERIGPGWLHELRNGPAWAPWRLSLRKLATQQGGNGHADQ